MQHASYLVFRAAAVLGLALALSGVYGLRPADARGSSSSSSSRSSFSSSSRSSGASSFRRSSSSAWGSSSSGRSSVSTSGGSGGFKGFSRPAFNNPFSGWFGRKSTPAAAPSFAPSFAPSAPRPSSAALTPAPSLTPKSNVSYLNPAVAPALATPAPRANSTLLQSGSKATALTPLTGRANSAALSRPAPVPVTNRVYATPGPSRPYLAGRPAAVRYYYVHGRSYPAYRYTPSMYWASPQWYYYTPFHPAFYYNRPVIVHGALVPGGVSWVSAALATLFFLLLLAFLWFCLEKASEGQRLKGDYVDFD